MDEQRLRGMIDRELQATIRLNQRGTLARVYDCPGHVASVIDRSKCRFCWTDIDEERANDERQQRNA